MLQIKKILFPTDFSACAGRAFSHAAYLADQYEATLHVLHVVETPRTDADDLLEDLVISEEELADKLHMAPAKPGEKQGQNTPGIVQAQRHGALPASAILAYAEEHAIDLIVMGTQGRRGIARMLLGSVAEEVIRLSKCPVLTVCTGRERVPWKTIHRLLVPIDFSEHSKAALRYAGALSGAYGAHLDLVHVLEEVGLPVAHGIEPVAPAMADVKARAERALREMASREVGSDRFSVEVKVGHAATEVLAYAKAHRVDLIVISTHGRTGLKRLLLGSVAEQIVRRAPCPVFTLKSFGRDLLPPTAAVRGARRNTTLA